MVGVAQQSSGVILDSPELLTTQMPSLRTLSIVTQTMTCRAGWRNRGTERKLGLSAAERQRATLEKIVQETQGAVCIRLKTCAERVHSCRYKGFFCIPCSFGKIRARTVLPSPPVNGNAAVWLMHGEEPRNRKRAGEGMAEDSRQSTATSQGGNSLFQKFLTCRLPQS